MAGSTYSSNLKIELMATGENSGTWGDITNTNLGTALEQAIVGYGNPDYVADANLTISITNSNAAQAARALVLNVTSAFGALTQTRELVVPTIQKQYIVQNNTAGGQSITVKTSAGTGITVPNGRKAHLYVDGTNVIQMFDFVDINGGTIDGATVGANSASSGAFTTLTASGATTLNGAVTLGDAAGDNITFNGTVTSHLLFTDNTYDIGASGATRPRNLFLAGAATIGGNLSVGGTLTLTGGVNLNGNVTVGDNSSDTLTINSTITSNLIFTDNTYDIGASGATRPRNLFLAGSGTIGGNVTTAGRVIVDDTTDSTSATTGSIQTDGGLGIAKALFVGTSVTINGGTANGVAYLNGSKVLTTGSALTFDGSTLTNVNGAIRASGSTVPSSGAGLELLYGASGSGISTILSYSRTASTYQPLWIDASYQAYFIGGSERVRLDTSGNFLVGTTSGIGKLAVTPASGTGSASTWDNTFVTIAPGGTSTSTGLAFSVNTSTNTTQITSLTPGVSWRELKYKALQHTWEVGASQAQAMILNGDTPTVLRLKGSTSNNGGGAFYVLKAGAAGTHSAFGDSAAILGGTPDAATTVWSASDAPLTFYIGSERARFSTAGNLTVGGGGLGAAGDPRVSVISKSNYFWGSANGLGDFYIGDGTYGIAMGVATGGGGAGTSRIWAQNNGVANVLTLGVANNDKLLIYPNQVTVQSAGDATLAVTSIAGAFSSTLDLQSSSAGAGTINTSQYFRYTIAGTERARLTGSGDWLVGGTSIGATDPGSPQINLISAVTSTGQWTSRIVARNTGNDTSSFLGNYKDSTRSTAGVFAHNAPLSAWSTLYVNTIDGTYSAAGGNGGNVVLSGQVFLGKVAFNLSQNGCAFVNGDTTFTISAGNTLHVYDGPNGAYRFYVSSAGQINATSTTISGISDQRLKENIQDIDAGLDAVMALKPRKFDWKAGKGKGIKGDRGWIAQEFEQVFPDMIEPWKEEAPEGEEPYKAVRADLIPVLVKAIQEQQTIIESLKARLDAANL